MTKYAHLSDDRLYALVSAVDGDSSAANGAADSEAAFRELYTRHGRRVHAYCVRIVGNETHAEDIFQETFVRFFNAAKAGERTMTNVPAFLLRIARNLCLNYKRDIRSTVSILDEDFAHAPHDYDSSELLSLITTALELLDHEQREAFVLRKYQDLSYEEIADLTNTTANNARSRVHRAQQRIREILAPYLTDLNQHL